MTLKHNYLKTMTCFIIIKKNDLLKLLHNYTCINTIINMIIIMIIIVYPTIEGLEEKLSTHM